MKSGLVEYFIVAILCLVDRTAGGSCRAAKLCCQGRDSGCVIQKASPNAIIESPRDKPCYCDHACLKLNDCCDDFRDACSVADCAVSEWGTWSPCKSQCGVGIQTRNRVITKAELNGGKHCPQLEQSRTCRGFAGCREHSELSHKGTVLLTTLSEKNSTSDDVNSVPSYCQIFTVLWASRICTREFPDLTLGSQICALCREDSGNCQSGEEYVAPTGIGRWKIMTSTSTRCHGRWIASTNLRNYCDTTGCEDMLSLKFI
ncbi:somatomedin-B and thrombospondin type-1 domain-containing protein [Fopius arisanus]|uniref:RPESP_1 protein n=1 Tax=Fopius arisanus TaxID=64838 RepID=A0A0C9PV87_9HYME|nr:PREDICTED: somatomedin-B and thrombospondin type-1 domain-containing protein-like [Fopius arisanus]